MKVMLQWIASAFGSWSSASPHRHLSHDNVKKAITVAAAAAATTTTIRRNTALTPMLCKALLVCEPSDGTFIEDSDPDNQTLPFRGVPKHPLYCELSRRLKILYRCQQGTEDRHHQASTALLLQDDKVLTPASILTFSELERPTLPPKIINGDVSTWFHQAGHEGVFFVLGLRKTVGTIPLLPPSWTLLLRAANQIHKQTLSVAARARAKHAHRGTGGFFGIAKGSPQDQNLEAEQLVLKLLHEAVWINMHTFGGMNGQPVVEIRIESGYGARWMCEYEDDHTITPSNAVFRGFLEPQMENGHELKWRHNG